ncbi:hypothetical protein Bpfe_002604, partial [Biomphalaria pfeifferi]
MQLKSRLNPLLRNLTCHVAALLLAIIVLVSPYIRIKGASTTMGHHFVFQVPYLQEVGGFAVVSIVTSWNKPFLVKMTIPHVKGIMPREFMLYRLEPVSVELRNMFKLDCHRKRQYVQHVTIRSDPYNMFAVFVSVMDSFLSIETFPAVPVASFTDNYYIVTFDINPVLVVSHYPFEDNHLVTQRLEYESQYKGCTVSTLFVLLELFTLHGDSGIFESCNRTTYSAGQRGEPYLSKQCDLVVSKIPNQSYT